MIISVNVQFWFPSIVINLLRYESTFACTDCYEDKTSWHCHIRVGDFCMDEGCVGVLTPAGLPQTAAWALSPSQGDLGHQASWQPLSCSNNESLFLLLLQGMAVVPFNELEKALETTQELSVHYTNLQPNKKSIHWHKKKWKYLHVSPPYIVNISSLAILELFFADNCSSIYPQLQKLMRTLSSEIGALIFSGMC